MRKIVLSFFVFTSICMAMSEAKCEGKCGIEQNITENNIKNVKYSDLENKYVIYSKIDCPACNVAYKEVEKVKKRYQDMTNIAVVILPNYTKNEINSYFKSKKYTFEKYYDGDRKILNVLNIDSVPSIFKYENNIFTEFDSEYFTEKTYYEKEKYSIDKKVREKLLDVEVLDKKNNRFKLLDILPSDALVMYGAPWCGDCVKEYERLNNIKGNRALIYLIESGRYTKEEFEKYSNDKENVYYVLDRKIRNNFNLKWIPSVTEIKNGLFTGPFVRNDVYRFK